MYKNTCILYMYYMYFVLTFIGSFIYVLSMCFSLSSFLKIIDSFEGLLGPAPPTRLIMVTDNRLRKQIQEQSTRFQKVPPTQLINYGITTY